MNILFFLMPKSEVTFLSTGDAVCDAIKTMNRYKYTSIPMVDEQGAYAGTITEGDLFLFYREQISADEALLAAPVTVVPRRQDNRPVLADTDMEDLVSSAMNQNFVPVIDDRGCFIGIITRRAIIGFLYEKYQRAAKGGITGKAGNII